MKVYTHKKYSYVKIAEIPLNEIDKINFDICHQPKETLDSYYQRQEIKPDIMINGGFFDMSSGEGCFNYILNHKIRYNFEYYKWGIGIVGDKDISYGEMSEKKWKDWISGFPPLLYNGEKMDIVFAQQLNYNARRTALGFNDTTVFFVCIENPGMKYEVMQNLLLDIGCKYAINLDGGGSTRMLYNGVVVTTDRIFNRPVDNIIAIYLKSKSVMPISNINVIYQVYSKNKWWGKIKNYNNVNSNGYAGVNQVPIQALKVSLSEGSIQYRVHTINGKWWGWITDSNDINTMGYAGVIGRAIDAVQIRLVGNLAKTHNVIYRTSVVGGSSYLNWVYNADGIGSAGYSGIMGKTIDKIQIQVQKK